MHLEPTVYQFCSEPSSVKLNKEVKNDLLKKACAKLAARSLPVRAVKLHLLDGSENPRENLATSTLLSILQQLTTLTGQLWQAEDRH